MWGDVTCLKGFDSEYALRYRDLKVSPVMGD